MYKTLGFYLNPDGNQTEEIVYLQHKTKILAMHINVNMITRYEAIMAFNQVLVPAIMYSGAYFSITEHQSLQIIRPAIRALIPSIWYIWTTYRTLIHSPKKYCGLDIIDIHTKALSQKLQWIKYHLVTTVYMGDLLKIWIQHHKQESGLSTPMLEINWKKTNFLFTKSWIKHLWEQLDKLDTKTIIPTSTIYNIITIMDTLVD